MSKSRAVAVVGATGVIGAQIVECLEEREFPVGIITFLARGKGAGSVLEFRGKPVPVEELRHDSFEGIDLAFFAAGEECSREFCPSAVRAGAICIDTSSAWRMDPDVPLVVPEVNPHAIEEHTRTGIIAIPTGSVIQMAVALNPLHRYAGIRRIVVSTYHPVSGSGNKAIGELQKQVGELLNGRPVASSVYPHQIAFNCLPQVDSFEPNNGYTKEELRLVNETRRIMGSDIKVTATAVRVPVFYGLSEAIWIETGKKVSAGMARCLLADAPGVELVDDPPVAAYPMAITAAGQDQVMVGRIREDQFIDNGLNLWVVADNLRKGSATTAVQVAELVAGY